MPLWGYLLMFLWVWGFVACLFFFIEGAAGWLIKKGWVMDSELHSMYKEYKKLKYPPNWWRILHPNHKLNADEQNEYHHLRILYYKTIGWWFLITILCIGIWIIPSISFFGSIFKALNR